MADVLKSTIHGDVAAEMGKGYDYQDLLAILRLFGLKDYVIKDNNVVVDKITVTLDDAMIEVESHVMDKSSSYVDLIRRDAILIEEFAEPKKIEMLHNAVSNYSVYDKYAKNASVEFKFDGNGNLKDLVARDVYYVGSSSKLRSRFPIKLLEFKDELDIESFTVSASIINKAMLYASKQHYLVKSYMDKYHMSMNDIDSSSVYVSNYHPINGNTTDWKNIFITQDFMHKNLLTKIRVSYYTDRMDVVVRPVSKPEEKSSVSYMPGYSILHNIDHYTSIYLSNTYGNVQ